MLKERGVVSIFVLIAAIGLLSYIVVSNTTNFKNKLFSKLFPKPLSYAAERGQSGDLWADIVLGQSDFNQIIPKEKTAFKVAGPGGVLVDTTIRPNRVYVYDGMNSRVLGFSSIDNCANSQPCSADLVIGQPDFEHGACNGDGTSLTLPPTSASSLCSTKPAEHSPFEGGSFAGMDVDSGSNLYVPDVLNNRVLKYNSPFTSDTVADEVWGQDNFTSNACNKGGSLSATSLCFEGHQATSGVDIDPSGNLWVADDDNNRVLRFPNVGGNISKTADLVLGQVNFTSNSAGSGLDQFNAPSAVKIHDGKVYVSDSLNNRVMVFDALPSNGASGRVFTTQVIFPAGLAIDTVNSGIWVNDMGSKQASLFDFNGTRLKTLRGMQDTRGGVGVTQDGDILVSGSENVQDVWIFKHPIPNDTFTPQARLFYPPDRHNYLYNKGLQSPRGIAVTNDQLIVADALRLVFWNTPNGISDLSNFKQYDGVAGAADFNILNYDTNANPNYSRISKDNKGNLWVLRLSNEIAGSRIERYTLPLTMGQLPTQTVRAEDLKILGQMLPLGITGKTITFSSVWADPNGRYLWLAAPYHNRVARVRVPQNYIDDYLIDVLIGGDNFPPQPLSWTSDTRCSGQDPNIPCFPGAVVEDRNGNLFVSDMYLEFHGSKKLYRFGKDTFPLNSATLIVKNLTNAVQIFTNVAAWQPTFDVQNRIVVPFSFYDGLSRYLRYYDNILSQRGPNISHNGEFMDTNGQPFTSEFDSFGNLYVTDLSWGRVLIYLNPFNSTLIPTPTSTTVPPQTLIISDISVRTSSDSAVIRWRTNLPAKSGVEYGIETFSRVLDEADTSYTKTHRVIIEELSSSTTYSYRIKALSEIEGLRVTSPPGNFTTK